MARRAIRVCDLAEPRDARRQARRAAAATTTRCSAASARAEIDRAALRAALLDVAPQLLPFAEPVWERLDEARRAGKRILFEGAQAAMLDVDHGTYPLRHLVQHGGRRGRDRLRHRARRASATCSASPRPTPRASAPARSRPSCPTQIGQPLGERGREFGTVTGRPRRCGWFDAVMVRQAVKRRRHPRHRADQARRARRLATSSRSAPATACGGETLAPPARRRRRRRRRSSRSTRRSRAGARSRAAPAPGPTCRPTAVKYIRRIEELIDAPVALLSTSPERDDTILVADPFAD